MSTLVKEPVQQTQTEHLTWDVKIDTPYLNGNRAVERGKDDRLRRADTPKSKAGMRVSEEEYWTTYYEDADFSYEWNNGILEEKPVSTARGIDQYSWSGRIVDAFIETNPIARAMRLEMGCRMEVADETTIRKPDLFVVRNDNVLPMQDLDRSYWGVCDLCIEALSDSTPGEVRRDVVTKYNEYERVGVREYYILDPEGEHTAFYFLNEAGRYEQIPIGADGILRSRVLPGFQFRLQDLYRMPSMIEMAEDEVYRHYVIPAYHQEKERANQAEARVEHERLARNRAEVEAEQERQRAEQERQRAEQERQRAEQEQVARRQAEAQAEQERQRAAEANTRAEQMAAQLRALGLLKD